MQQCGVQKRATAIMEGFFFTGETLASFELVMMDTEEISLPEPIPVLVDYSGATRRERDKEDMKPNGTDEWWRVKKCG